MKYTVTDSAGRFLTGHPTITPLGVHKPSSYHHQDAMRMEKGEAKAIAIQLGDGWQVYNLEKQEQI